MTGTKSESSKTRDLGRIARNVVRILFAVLFVVAGSMHFLKPHFYEAIMPEWIPMPELCVSVSGAAEILGGLGLSAPLPLARIASIGLVLLLLAVYPVNINMAVNPEDFPKVAPWILWLRLPLQFVMIYGVLWSTGLTSKFFKNKDSAERRSDSRDDE